jgi:hypothetical protein
VRRRLIGLLAVCALAGVWTNTAGQKKKDAKEAAKRAIDAFFREKPGGSSTTPRLLANLSDKRISESSGLAVSRVNPEILWTHNDSGGGSHLFAIDRRGRTLVRYEVPNVPNIDWEDIASGPGRDGKPALYIGDIGDNSRTRNDLAVCRIVEPSVATGKTMQKAQTAPAERFPFRYPDRIHNAESLMVHPKTGEIFIVTKEASGVSGVYAFPMPLQPDRKVTLQKVAPLTFTSQFGGRIGEAERSTTGGAISPDGRHLVIRTYLSAYEWDIAPGQSVADAFKAKPRQSLLPFTRQGESICYRADSKAWLVTSEERPSPLYEIPLR